jgi:hypothetical protein
MTKNLFTVQAKQIRFRVYQIDKKESAKAGQIINGFNSEVLLTPNGQTRNFEVDDLLTLFLGKTIHLVAMKMKYGKDTVKSMKLTEKMHLRMEVDGITFDSFSLADTQDFNLKLGVIDPIGKLKRNAGALIETMLTVGQATSQEKLLEIRKSAEEYILEQVIAKLKARDAKKAAKEEAAKA